MHLTLKWRASADVCQICRRIRTWCYSIRESWSTFCVTLLPRCKADRDATTLNLQFAMRSTFFSPCMIYMHIHCMLLHSYVISALLLCGIWMWAYYSSVQSQTLRKWQHLTFKSDTQGMWRLCKDCTCYLQIILWSFMEYLIANLTSFPSGRSFSTWSSIFSLLSGRQDPLSLLVVRWLKLAKQRILTSVSVVGMS